MRKKVLLMGKSGSGKSSMRSIIFNNYIAKDTRRLGATIDVEHSHVRFLGNLVLNLWDCGGQDAFMENYLSTQRDHIFRNVEVLIYVFDVESREFNMDLHTYESCLEAIRENSPKARVFCLIHKMDLVQEEMRDCIYQERFKILYERSENLETMILSTSIWDETLYKAWSSIVYTLVPNVPTLEKHLKQFAFHTEADEVVLFERTTFLVISHTSHPEFDHPDIHLAGNKMQSQFTSFELRTRIFSAFIAPYACDTYILVVLSDPLGLTIVSIKNNKDKISVSSLILIIADQRVRMKKTNEKATAPLPIALGDALLLHPLSILRLLIRIFTGTRVPVCQGTLDISSTSVHVNDTFSIERLWKGGFFGKGSLSRSALSWETRMKRLLGLIGPDEAITSEERTFQRRLARRAFKQRRAQREGGNVGVEEEILQKKNTEEGKIELEIKDDNETRAIFKKELPKVFPNVEYMQLRLEEAFFLSYALGVLEIEISKGIHVKTSMDLLLLFCSLCSEFNSQIEPGTKSSIQADNRFLISYVAYHHYRSLGWVVRPGIKFALLRPVFSHSEFTITLIPSYSEKKEGNKELSWYWLHCINRVISQVKKTIVLCYVEIPPKDVFEKALKTNRVDEVLKKYKIREIECFAQVLAPRLSGIFVPFNAFLPIRLNCQKRFFQTYVDNKEQLKNQKNESLDTNESFDSVLEFYSRLFDLNKTEVSTFLPPDLLWQALTHKSYKHGKFPYNEKLSFQGRQVLKFHFALHITSLFPIYKNENVLTFKKMNDFVSPQTIGTLALKYGIDQVLRWKPAYDNLKASGLLKIASESLCAIIGAMFLHKGGAITKNFIEKKILPQKTCIFSIRLYYTTSYSSSP
ncbi:hypothetical protein PORY_000137 [Pneumocystis oryctolagi]|uniref:Uncharacterized protein n=1 Tax=Pneumocystis oryctolagi TaxID=42067 RepID=A0ACB7CGK3_9ASCO|nr:hypothetical protein PORY_000137 [Pneumocystis oryctolagi]